MRGGALLIHRSTESGVYCVPQAERKLMRSGTSCIFTILDLAKKDSYFLTHHEKTPDLAFLGYSEILIYDFFGFVISNLIVFGLHFFSG